MINGFISLDRVRSPEELETLCAQAQEDNHGLFLPTHVLRKDGKMVGYFSVGHPGGVIVFAWLSTADVPARESFHLVNAVEDMVARTGAKYVCFPVPRQSPFHPLMESMGYKDGGEYTFWIKEV
jgi:hypothetical protein